jgi:hypothetical protein
MVCGEMHGNVTFGVTKHEQRELCRVDYNRRILLNGISCSDKRKGELEPEYAKNMSRLKLVDSKSDVHSTAYRHEAAVS